MVVVGGVHIFGEDFPHFLQTDSVNQSSGGLLLPQTGQMFKPSAHLLFKWQVVACGFLHLFTIL